AAAGPPDAPGSRVGAGGDADDAAPPAGARARASAARGRLARARPGPAAHATARRGSGDGVALCDGTLRLAHVPQSPGARRADRTRPDARSEWDRTAARTGDEQGGESLGACGGDRRRLVLAPLSTAE